MGRSGGRHILQGRKDSRWAAVQNAAYGHLRSALIMGVGHMQASVAAATRRMWVATVDSTATSRGVRGEPGRPADINKALGYRKKPPHCKDRSAARATEGVALENGLGRSRGKRTKDVRRPWRSAHPCRRSGDVYSRG